MNTMASTPARRIWSAPPLVLTAILLAWALALASEFTGIPGWVHHHHLLSPDMAAWASIGLFLAAWQIHIAAMMLPSTLTAMTGLELQKRKVRPAMAPVWMNRSPL